MGRCVGARLGSQYDSLLLDLDGTVYRGAEPIPGAAEALGSAGVPVVFVTNNASRAAEDVAAQLRSFGVSAVGKDVVTSAEVGAELLASLVPAGSEVVVVGASALDAEVQKRGLVAVRECTEAARGVVQGFSPDVDWRMLAEASLVINRGGVWVATNVDTTLPSPRGLLPGNGSLVSVLSVATGAKPEVAGKPGARIFLDGAVTARSDRPLVVGDRLDTDIAGGTAAGMDTLLVLTGVSGVAEAVRAPSSMRPVHIGRGLECLAEPAELTIVGPKEGWSTAREGDRMRLSFSARAAGTGCAYSVLAGVRAAAWAAWTDGFDGLFFGTDPVSELAAAACNGA